MISVFWVFSGKFCFHGRWGFGTAKTEAPHCSLSLCLWKATVCQFEGTKEEKKDKVVKWIGEEEIDKVVLRELDSVHNLQLYSFPV